MNPEIVATAVKIGIALGLLINVAPVMLWVERRGSALMQDRPGPNRLGPLGLFQGLADKRFRVVLRLIRGIDGIETCLYRGQHKLRRGVFLPRCPINEGRVHWLACCACMQAVTAPMAPFANSGS